MERVVLTGLGAVSPVGLDAPTAWDAALAGRSGTGPLTRFAADGWPVQIAAEVKGFAPSPLVHPRDVKRMDLFAQYGLVAALEALRDAGLAEPLDLGDRAGVYVGSGIGGIGEIAGGADTARDEGADRLSPFFIPRSLANLAAGHIAMRVGARGPSLCVATACATGNHAIGEAFRALQRGDADLIIAGGAEAALIPLGLGGFMVMRALSRRNDAPESASRPFERSRDGFVMGEGAGVVVLETLTHARARGARIWCEIVGYGLTNDAFHLTAPPPGHAGAARAMRLALADARLPPEAVDYINAHGTSTPTNDPEEVAAVKAVFGAHASRLCMSSTKGVTGHLLGAAGGVEAVFCARALAAGVVPPTAHLDEVDPDCAGVDLVPRVAQERRLRVAMSNGFGFGGTNAVLVFQAFDGASA
jgi:3-oxoacyl-[acyl-carrier-protein] synthase II